MKFGIRSGISGVALLIGIGLVAVTPTNADDPPETIRLVGSYCDGGENDGLLAYSDADCPGGECYVSDGQVIQDAIDTAPDGAIIELIGVFQLYESLLVKHTITLVGVEIDNDGDGLVNEDWANDHPDFADTDNDEDGLVDEDGWDAVIRGWIWVRTPERFNGIDVGGLDGELEDLTIKGIEFNWHLAAISLHPDSSSPIGLASTCIELPSEDVRTAGSLLGAKFERNHFQRNSHSVQVFGDVREAAITDNVFTGRGGIGVKVGSFYCSEENEKIEVEMPQDTLVADNLARGQWNNVFETDTPTWRTRFEHNEIWQPAGGGIELSFGFGNVVYDNSIHGGWLGIWGGGEDWFQTGSTENTNNLILENRIEGTAFAGILVGVQENGLPARASGFTLIDNEIIDGGMADYLIGTLFSWDFPALDTALIADANGGEPYTVCDEGEASIFYGDFVAAEGCPEIEVEDYDRLKVTICHVPPGNPDNAMTKTVSIYALKAHIEHGDYLGPCDCDDS